MTSKDEPYLQDGLSEDELRKRLDFDPDQYTPWDSIPEECIVGDFTLIANHTPVSVFMPDPPTVPGNAYEPRGQRHSRHFK